MVVLTTLEFNELIKNEEISSYLIIGEKKYINSNVNKSLKALFKNEKINIDEELLEPINKDSCNNITQYVKREKKLIKIVFAKIDSKRSRNLGIIRADSIGGIVSKHVDKDENCKIIVLIDNSEQARSAGVAISRVFPLFNKKTGQITQRKIFIEFIVNDNSKVNYEEVQIISNATRYAAKLSDIPAENFNPETAIEESKTIIERLKKKGKNVTLTIIKGEELCERKFGGLWNVGKGSKYPPALIVLSYKKSQNKKTVAWVGKGITYDTGGLCLKSRDGMCGMKQDMGGSASVLAAFEAAVLLEANVNVYGIMCMAENAIGPNSERPDDIIQLYSGKTIEINNTDAEGRLVVSDGVAYATKNLNVDYVIDIATLTGAQSYATGIYHSGVLSSSEELEKDIVTAGKISGDLCYPLIYCPEYLGIESQYKSSVADMKNSVKTRNNAASSCAGHFIEEQLDSTWKEEQCRKYGNEYNWAHLDIAYPAVDQNGRATGYGVPLFIEIAKIIGNK